MAKADPQRPFVHLDVQSAYSVGGTSPSLPDDDVRALVRQYPLGPDTAEQPRPGDRAERRISHDVKEYPDAGQGFLDRVNVGPFTPVLRVVGLGYHQPSADDAWRRILAFFATQLQVTQEA